MRDGRELIGYGMASGIWEALRVPTSADVELTPEGRLVVSTAAADIGTGTYTILTQIGAEMLGLALDKSRSGSAIPICRPAPSKASARLASWVRRPLSPMPHFTQPACGCATFPSPSVRFSGFGRAKRLKPQLTGSGAVSSG